MPFNDIYSKEWEDELGKEIAKALEQPLNDLQNDLLDYAKTAYEVGDAIRKVITGDGE